MYVSSGTCEHPATGKMTYHWTLFPEKNYVQVLYIARIFRNFCPKSSICLWLSAVAATFGRWQHSLCSRCASRIAVIVLTKIRVCDYTLCSLCEETLNPLISYNVGIMALFLASKWFQYKQQPKLPASSLQR
jgi:hypothetical protein